MALRTALLVFVVYGWIRFWGVSRRWPHPRWLWRISVAGMGLAAATLAADVLDDLLGLFGGQSPVVTRFTYGAAGFLIAFALLRWVLQADRVLRQLQSLAVTDPLTGLANRRALESRFHEERARSRRSGRPFTVMLLDLVHFKEVNDRFGHLVGDRVLQEVARALSGCVRAEDLVCRFGGDEFAILWVEAGPAQHEAFARRTADALRHVKLPVRGSSLEATSGCATWPEDGDSLEALLAVADRRIYEKRLDGQGRRTG